MRLGRNIYIATTLADQGTLYAGSFENIFNQSLTSRGVNSLLPASKGEVQKVQSENDQQKLINNQQNVIITQLVKQVNALTPVSGFASAAW